MSENITSPYELFTLLSSCATYFTLAYIYSTRQVKANVEQESTEPISIMHPEAVKAESIIRNAWADSNLVAD